MDGLFVTPGMTALSVGIILVELLSLAFLWAASYEYRQLIRRHAGFFEAIDGGGRYAHIRRTSRAIYACYVLSTLAVTTVTLLLFVFQPHLL